jgi:hypothetical protein
MSQPEHATIAVGGWWRVRRSGREILQRGMLLPCDTIRFGARRFFCVESGHLSVGTVRRSNYHGGRNEGRHLSVVAMSVPNN